MLNPEQKCERGQDDKKQQKGAEKLVKKRILIIFSIIMISIIVMYIAVLFIESGAIENLNNKNEKPIEQAFVFHIPDFSENIFEDSEYMSLDRNIYLYDIATGVTEALDIDAEQSPEIRFMIDFIYNIINGQSYTYNSLFDEKLYINEVISPKNEFTMQKLYNIKLTRMYEENVNNYTKYFFALEYMISENNGTFRTDIGSDGSKTQYIILSLREDGKFIIESIQ